MSHLVSGRLSMTDPMDGRGCASPLRGRSGRLRPEPGISVPVSALRGPATDALPLVTTRVRKPDFSLWGEEAERIWNGEAE